LSETQASSAPPGLKVVHAAVFLFFAGLAVSAASPELAQLRFAASGPYHAGTPPFWPAVIGSALAVGGYAVVLVRLVQKKEVSLFVSGAIGLGLVLALTVNATQPAQRSIDGANVALVEIARELQRGLGARLQKDAEVPLAWDDALAAALNKHADQPFEGRDRLFRSLKVRTQQVSEARWEGQGAVPGTLGIWVSDDRAQFTITPIGLTLSGQPGLLRDDRDQPIHYRGVYNPDMAGRQGHSED
jgi:hypothetical protein